MSTVFPAVYAHQGSIIALSFKLSVPEQDMPHLPKRYERARVMPSIVHGSIEDYENDDFSNCPPDHWAMKGWYRIEVTLFPGTPQEERGGFPSWPSFPIEKDGQEVTAHLHIPTDFDWTGGDRQHDEVNIAVRGSDGKGYSKSIAVLYILGAGS